MEGLALSTFVSTRSTQQQLINLQLIVFMSMSLMFKRRSYIALTAGVNRINIQQSLLLMQFVSTELLARPRSAIPPTEILQVKVKGPQI